MITNIATVKILAQLYTKTGTGAPATNTVGGIGDVYLDNDSESVTFGNSYILESIAAGPPISYTWAQDTTYDAQINLMIERAEIDYQSIQGKPFTISDEETQYPTQGKLIAGEMVCFLIGIGQYEGRHVKMETLSSRHRTIDSKLGGYPTSIVSAIKRYVGMQ